MNDHSRFLKYYWTILWESGLQMPSGPVGRRTLPLMVPDESYLGLIERSKWVIYLLTTVSKVERDTRTPTKPSGELQPSRLESPTHFSISGSHSMRLRHRQAGRKWVSPPFKSLTLSVLPEIKSKAFKNSWCCKISLNRRKRGVGKFVGQFKEAAPS